MTTEESAYALSDLSSEIAAKNIVDDLLHHKDMFFLPRFLSRFLRKKRLNRFLYRSRIFRMRFLRFFNVLGKKMRTPRALVDLYKITARKFNFYFKNLKIKKSKKKYLLKLARFSYLSYLSKLAVFNRKENQKTPFTKIFGPRLFKIGFRFKLSVRAFNRSIKSIIARRRFRMLRAFRRSPMRRGKRLVKWRKWKKLSYILGKRIRIKWRFISITRKTSLSKYLMYRKRYIRLRKFLTRFLKKNLYRKAVRERYKRFFMDKKRRKRIAKLFRKKIKWRPFSISGIVKKAAFIVKV